MKNMLGDNEVLRRVWSGPLLTFLERLNGKDGEIWETEFNRFNRKETCWVDSKGAGSIKSTITLPPVSTHNMAGCFQDSDGVKFYRDPDLDSWTPGDRKEHKGGRYNVDSLTRRQQFRQIAAQILGIENVVDNSRDPELQELLIERGHCVEPKQIEDLVRGFEQGKQNTGLEKDDKATFFFVDNHDETVSVVDAWWRSVNRGWYVNIHRFGDDHCCLVGDRFVSRNLDPGTL
jgi:hypothetical protein